MNYLMALVLTVLFSTKSYSMMERCHIYWAFGKLECSPKACYQILNKGTLSESAILLDGVNSPLHGMDILTKIKILNKPRPNRYKAKVISIAPVSDAFKHGLQFARPLLVMEGQCD